MMKTKKRFTALALTCAMVMGMSTMGFADPVAQTKDDTSSFTTAGDSVTSDTSAIKLIKDFDVVNAGTSAQGTVKFTITPYGVWNAGSSTGFADGDKYTVGNMPKFTSGKAVNGTDQGNIYTITTAKTATIDNSDNVEVELPEYKSVGDFWYLVQESNTTVNADATNGIPAYQAMAGVIYGTNDKETESLGNENGAHTAKYYLHVQVVNNPDYIKAPTGTDTRTDIQKLEFLRTATLHTVAPEGADNTAYNSWVDNNYSNPTGEGETPIKVNDIQNKYYAGSLTIKKEVTGNAGDKDKRFAVVVTFTKPENTIINSDITYSAYTSQTSETLSTSCVIKGQHNTVSDWYTSIGSTETESSAFGLGTESLTSTNTNVGYAQVTIYIKNDEEVTFSNIPYGVTYTVRELEPADDTYKNKLVFESADGATTFDNISLNQDVSADTLSDTFTKKATGSISDDSDKITITNEKTTKIDIGVVLSNTPYLAILACALTGGFLFSRRRKKNIEE